MPKPRPSFLPPAALLLGGTLGLILIAALLTQITMAHDFTNDQQARSTQQRQRTPRPEPKVKVGQLAPDFNLHVLQLDTNAAGKPIGKINDNNKIRLSSYFGKKPVCLIMSSYT